MWLFRHWAAKTGFRTIYSNAKLKAENISFQKIFKFQPTHQSEHLLSNCLSRLFVFLACFPGLYLLVLIGFLNLD